ncbi:prepilin-type N-terminal cleavage/methylation domain-containing protein [Erwinia tracheiphila]
MQFEGYQSADWQMSLSQRSEQGCIMLTSGAVSNEGKCAVLSRLHCEN